MKNIKAFNFSHKNNYSLFFHKKKCVCVFSDVSYIYWNSVGLKFIAEHFDELNNLKLVDFNIHNFKCSDAVWKHF